MIRGTMKDEHERDDPFPGLPSTSSAGWAEKGRRVVPGEKADTYIVSPDGKRRIALFHEAQTLASDIWSFEYLDWVIVAGGLTEVESAQREVQGIRAPVPAFADDDGPRI